MAERPPAMILAIGEYGDLGDEVEAGREASQKHPQTPVEAHLEGLWLCTHVPVSQLSLL